MRLGRKLAALWRRSSVPAPGDAGANEPCIPCGDQRGVRQFSLNPGSELVIRDDLRLGLAPRQQYAGVDDQLVVYDPTRAMTHVLNGTAALVWATIDGVRTVAEIVDVLVTETGADRSLVDPDTRRTLGRFLDLGIVVEEEPTSAAPPPPDRAARWAPTLARALDRHRWLAVLGPVRAAGVDLVVRTDDPALVDALSAIVAGLPPTTPEPTTAGPPTERTGPAVLSVRDAGPGRHPRHRLYTDGLRGWTTDDADRVLELTATELNRIAIDRTPEGHPGWLLLHAGAVERDGRVIAVTGASGHGKSTLTARLVQRGWAFVTDELAAVDPGSLEVLVFPQALALDAGSRALLGLADAADTRAMKHPVRPAELGQVSDGGRLELVVMLGDDPADDSSSGASPAVRDLRDLIGVTFGRTFDDPAALAHLSDVAARVPVLRLGRDALDTMVERVESTARTFATAGDPTAG